jgi:hypothetical protein
MKKSEIKSEGQRQFLEVAGTEDELAEQIGWGRAIVGHWRRGARLPGVEARHRLKLLFGIPQRAWDVKPVSDVLSEAKPPLVASKPCEDDDTLAIAKQQLLEVRQELEATDLTDAARAKLRDTAAKLLALRSRLENAREMQEDRVIREHSGWQKVKADIITALTPFPEAAKAVAKALI